MAPRSLSDFAAAALLLTVLSACGSSSVTPYVAPPVSTPLTLSPANPTVWQGNSLTFRSSVGAVTWSVQEGAAGGTVTATGSYTAPLAAGTYHVIATLQSDTTKSATATITVPVVTISVSPATDVLVRGGVRAFTANINANNQTADWTVVEGASAGSLTNSTYTAPNTLGTYHVRATRRSDPTLTATATIAVVANGFRPTLTTRDERYAHTTTQLLDGRLLNVGGYTCFDYYYYTSCMSSSASFYDPNLNQLYSASPMQQRRAYHTATRLADGKVLIVGGGSAIAELYDPAKTVFATLGTLSMNRTGHTATLLGDGKVLIAGGRGVAAPVASAELFDPATGSFSTLANMTSPRANHTATRLPNGQVLIVGGSSANNATSPTAELYDPATRTFVATGSPGQARANHSATALGNGTVLLAGGSQLGPFRTLDSVEIYDPGTGRFTAGGTLLAPRNSHAALLLPGGKLLITGGSVSAPLSYNWTAELFDPATGASAQVGSMRDGRSPAYGTGVVLADGRVVITGGSGTSSVEIYQ